MGLTQFSVRSMIAILLSLGITACAGGPGSDALERSLEADPLLAEQEDVTAPLVSEPESDDADDPEVPVGLGLGQQIGQTEQPILPSRYADLEEAPEELQPYLKDLVALELLSLTAAEADVEDGDSTAPRLGPNQPISRRTFARWLMAVNNRLYQGAADKRIRQGVAGSDAAFEDVPADDPDFGAIQGLAEAGLIPSPLAGNDSAVNFRPEDPLTREELLLWKVPLDTREGLPTATDEAVAQAWGFRDADRIDSLALGAVLADHQAGEFANLRRAFGFTTLFQPDKAVTRAEAAAALWRFGDQADGRSAADVRSADDPDAEPDSDSESDADSHPLIDQLRDNR